MKIKDTHKRILFLVIGGFVLLVAYAAFDYLLLSHRTFLNLPLFDLSAYQINFRSVFLASFAVFGILAGLFSVLAKRILTKYRLTEEQYKKLVELSNDIITVSDRDGKLVFMNNAACRILERTPEEVIGVQFTELLHPADCGKYLAKHKVLEKVDTGSFSIETRYITKSGKAINVLQNVHVLKDEKGAVIGSQSIARDITDLKQAKDALQMALQQVKDDKVRLESVLSAIDDGISIQSPDFKILFQNPAHKTMTGGDCLGQACYQAHFKDDEICPGCPMADAFKDGEIHTLEKALSRDGEVRFLEIKASPLRDATGKIIAGIEAVRDITPRRNVEEKLKTFSAAMEEAMDGIQMLDLDGHIVYSNKAITEIFGFSQEELVGKHVNVLSAGREFTEQSILPKIRETGRWGGELSLVHKDGRPFPVWLSRTLVKDDQGQPIAMISIMRDITERKQSEGSIESGYEQLTKLVEELTRDLSAANEKLSKEISDRDKMEQELLKAQKLDGSMKRDHEQLTNLIEERTRELSSANEQLRKEIADRGKMEQEMLKAQTLDESMKREHEQLTKLVEELTRELANANELLRKEIADRGKREQELLKAQKYESLGGVAGGIAHDFNTLLASIMDNIAFAMRDLNPDDKAYRQLAGAEKASLRAQDLTRQLLTFAKGGVPVKRATAISDLIREATVITLHNTRVKFFYSLPENLWPADVDKGQISQVLKNLIVNAEHAMPKGGTITISSENAVVAEPSPLPLKPGNYVKISVRDHGVGISRDHLSMIFDPYVTTKEQGSGLGLATSYAIIKQHGGHIFAESEIGKGTTFNIYLHASLSEEATKLTREIKLFSGTG
jgi:PAS domain S-box-containing protein